MCWTSRRANAARADAQSLGGDVMVTMRRHMVLQEKNAMHAAVDRMVRAFCVNVLGFRPHTAHHAMDRIHIDR